MSSPFPERDDLRFKILFLDKEGGFGGSSRSLYFLIRHLDRQKIEPLVVLREEGPAVALYRDLGVQTLLISRAPLYKPSLRKNGPVLALFILRAWDFMRSFRLLSSLIRERGIDIVHMNHDGFFVYGPLLKRYTKARIVIHMRTMLPVNQYAVFQAKCIERVADRLIFISENELARYSDLCGKGCKAGIIVYNTAETPELKAESASGKETNPFKVIYLGNLTYNKGADRLIDIAVHLKSQGRDDVVFIVCGVDRAGRKEGQNGAIAALAERSGVGSFFRFVGHQSRPDRFLKEADILIRLSRWNDPWGRDIIEAMAWGKPVIATGSYDGFVEHGVNGFLHPEYNPSVLAKEIEFLSEHPEVVERMGKINRAKAKQLFDGPTNAAKVEAIYGAILKERIHASSIPSG